MGEDRFSRRDAIGGRLLGGLLKSFGATARDVREGVVGRQQPGAPSLPSLPVLHRPPGAIEESAFVAECTKCDACVRACPVDAITHAESFFGAAGGTPGIALGVRDRVRGRGARSAVIAARPADGGREDPPVSVCGVSRRGVPSVL
jgi:ferredoxin